MAELILIRHGKTAGNLLGRYIGSRTDEPLCDEGREGLAGKQLPEVERLYVSPMKRCVETAEILWPGFDQKKMQKVTDLRECDFGDFENKNYKELSGNGDYQAWIDSNGTLPFPNGESMDAFKSRCLEAFARIVEEVSGAEQEWIASGKTGIFRAGIVVHGGTIMAILEQYGYPKAAYFDYQVKNGCGYRLTPVEGTRLWNCLCLQ
ncbi:histidine phosphatase family protein [Hominiventricola filiformis]|uniref:Histidine phosphatase family protein n=1 Tax=Hominiventricola filiformis TaxID=2885352 RepID=A0AAE3DBF2_9FIRM|nr:histidine phosphatase family protein [Hominiventricola filiformis]MCC2125481.1 histidine phosphatase family protein [Hominiventricola filiformis]